MAFNLSLGDIAPFWMQTVQRGMVIPSNWIMEYENCHIDNCRSGLGIENGTSTTIDKIYANNCRDYGIALRALMYSRVGTTAVDFLNDPTLYPDRTRECSAYIFQSLIGTTIQSPGQEQTYGNGMVLDSLRFCTIKSGVNIGIGSDYSGTADIAFIKVKNALIGCEVTGNMGFNVKPTGLISGSANAAKHHNLFADGSVYFTGTTFHNNIVQAASSGLDAEAGWGNNNINEAFVVKRGGIYSRADASDVYGNILQGTGTTASTNALDVRNGESSSLLRLRDDGAVFALGVYQQTTGAAANVFVGSDGSLFQSTSALKYKDVIGPIPDDMVDRVMAMVGFIFSQKGDETKRRLVGLAADHFHAAGLTEFVHYGADGEPEG